MVDYSYYKWARAALVQRPDVDIDVVDLYKEIKGYEDEPNMASESEWATASGLEDLGGGSQVGVTVQMDGAKVGFEPNNSSVSSGTATSGDADGEKLTDLSATFEADGVLVGATVINLTDGSVGTIIAIDSETVVRHLPLGDGSLNTWTIGNSYKIWNIEQCSISGGNLVFLGGIPADAILPTAFTQVVLAASSSATLSDTGSPDAIADAVWDHADAEFLLKMIKNKKALVKTGSVWELIIYDDDNTTPILNKAIKDKDGNDIDDLAAGVLAQELLTSV